jgi:hypothetical protein
MNTLNKKITSTLIFLGVILFISCGKGEITNVDSDPNLNRQIDLQTAALLLNPDVSDSVINAYTNSNPNVSSSSNIGLSSDVGLSSSSTIVDPLSSGTTPSSSLDPFSSSSIYIPPTSSSISSSAIIPSSSSASGIRYVLTVTGGVASNTNPFGGQVVTLTASAGVGECFAGWSGPNVASVANPALAATTFTMPAADASVQASWTTCPVLTVAVVGLTNVADAQATAGGTKQVGQVVALSAVAQTAGLDCFQGWSGDVTSALPTASVTMDADKSVTATYSPCQTYALTVTAPGTGSNATVVEGSVVTVTAPAKNIGVDTTCFVDWTGPVADASALSTSVTVSSNITVTPNYGECPLVTPNTVEACLASGVPAASCTNGVMRSSAATPTSHESWSAWDKIKILHVDGDLFTCIRMQTPGFMINVNGTNIQIPGANQADPYSLTAATPDSNNDYYVAFPASNWFNNLSFSASCP